MVRWMVHERRKIYISCYGVSLIAAVRNVQCYVILISGTSGHVLSIKIAEPCVKIVAVLSHTARCLFSSCRFLRPDLDAVAREIYPSLFVQARVKILLLMSSCLNDLVQLFQYNKAPYLV